MNFRRHMQKTDGRLLLVTPLLNVVFLLLCLLVGGSAFAPAAHEGGVPFSAAAGGTTGGQASGAMVIDLAANGGLYVNLQSLSGEEVQARLSRLAHEVPESVVRVRVDREAPLAQVLRVLEACRNAEIDQYSLVVGSDE